VNLGSVVADFSNDAGSTLKYQRSSCLEAGGLTFSVNNPGGDAGAVAFGNPAIHVYPLDKPILIGASATPGGATGLPNTYASITLDEYLKLLESFAPSGGGVACSNGSIAGWPSAVLMKVSVHGPYKVNWTTFPYTAYELCTNRGNTSNRPWSINVQPSAPSTQDKLDYGAFVQYNGWYISTFK
jgi:hypothetical protein